MIAQIRGKIEAKKDKYIIVETGGIGYKVNVSSETLKRLPKLGEEVKLFTHLAVREDAMELYGFADAGELEFFELLIGISGIGPKSAIAILSLAPVETLKKAVSANDTSYLTKVSGIGRKSAEKIVFELKDKLGALEGGGSGVNLKEESDAIEALRALGYTTAESRDALKKVPPEILTTSQKVKEALKVLGSSV